MTALLRLVSPAPHNAAMPRTAAHPALSGDTPDAELIALLDRVASRDRQALHTLYQRCAGKLYGLALRVVGRADAAEDVLQEAFLAIWRNAGDYRASLSPPMAWLGLIVRSRGGAAHAADARTR
jgi:DNA-directed RNA polymerase specialized sigma24 family protein